METANAAPQSAPALAPVPAAKPLAMADDAPPWAQETGQPCASARGAKPPRETRPQAETVHWSIVALTLFTAIGVLIGGSGKDDTRSRELQPLVMPGWER